MSARTDLRDVAERLVTEAGVALTPGIRDTIARLVDLYSERLGEAARAAIRAGISEAIAAKILDLADVPPEQRPAIEEEAARLHDRSWAGEYTETASALLDDMRARLRTIVVAHGGDACALE